MYTLTGCPAKDRRIHVIATMYRHVCVEVVHKVLALHALVASISDLCRKELDNSYERRHCEEGAYPGIIYFCLGGHRVPYVCHQQMHAVMCGK